MYRSTFILGLMCVVLAAATVGVMWWLWSVKDERAQPMTGAPSLGIGLPDTKKDSRAEAVSAQSAVLWDVENGVIRYERNGFERRPIASLTKLMTAMVALDLGLDWDKEMRILPEEELIGGRLHMAPDEKVTVRDLWHGSLMGSANNATKALVRSLGIPEKEFIREMNRKAIGLGLEQTEFTDVTGLDTGNVSTAYEVARMAETAFRDYPKIRETTSKARYDHAYIGSGRKHTILNTNNMITDEGYKLSGSKTGYLNEAVFCLVVQGSGKYADRLAVVLGSPSEWSSMQDVKKLMEMP